MGLIVKDEMVKDVKTLGPGVTIKEASEMMAKLGLGSIVITERDKIVGMITERDILKKIVAAGEDPLKMKTGDIMTRDVLTVEEDKTIEDVIKIMESKRIKRVPVTKNGKLSGIITSTNVISTERSLDKKNEELQKAKADLEKKTEELEKFSKLVVGRELRMIELKEKLNKFEKKKDDKNEKPGN